MSLENLLSRLEISEQHYQYIDVFKNPHRLPINQIHLERTWRELKQNLPKDIEALEHCKDSEKTFFEKKTEVIPALDKRWVPVAVLYNFEPFYILQEKEENTTFLLKNIQFLETLDYLLNCNYHQFWCIVLFEPSAAVALQSFLINPILPFQSQYLEGENLEVYKAIYSKFLLVYEKMLTFKQSEIEYMPESFGLSKLKDLKLLNLPIVITLAVLYGDSDLAFVNKLVDIYFNDTSEKEFLGKEVEALVEETLIVLEMIGGYVCGFDESAVIVPISIQKRPPLFSLSWVYSVVNYLLCTVITSNALFRFHKPAVEIALDKYLPYRFPFIYVNVYRELYEYLDGRQEEQTNMDLFKRVLDEINLGRAECIELFHTFVSSCLDDALKHMGDNVKQEQIVEKYLKLLTTALEDEYFICDYNATYNVATQNEMFETCCDIDPTRTEFIVSCINKLPRNKKLQELSKLKPPTIENVFRNFIPVVLEEEPKISEPQPGSSRESASATERDIEEKIRSIIDMFPHLGDGFVFQCLESYNFNSSDVINAILENNLPPHLAEIPFDSIRIPPEPEPEQPILAYQGKKPDYDDALKLLNDKSEIKDIKNLVLEGVQYEYDHIYDDEYDDRFNDDVALPVADNPVDEELQTFNPNRKAKTKESESEEETSEDEGASGPSSARNRLNFCEDPAVLRERREAKFRAGHGARGGGNSQPKPKGDVVGKPKGQGQDKTTVLNRQRKNANKSGRANHNRKGGAQFKRNKGMIPS